MPFLKYLEIILQYLLSVVELFFITTMSKGTSYFNKTISTMLSYIINLVGPLGRYFLGICHSENLEKSIGVSHKNVQFAGAKIGVA